MMRVRLAWSYGRRTFTPLCFRRNPITRQMSNPDGLLDTLAHDLGRLADGRHHHPHGVLGPHREGTRLAVLLYLPRAHDVMLEDTLTVPRVGQTDFFLWQGDAAH